MAGLFGSLASGLRRRELKSTDAGNLSWAALFGQQNSRAGVSVIADGLSAAGHNRALLRASTAGSRSTGRLLIEFNESRRPRHLNRIYKTVAPLSEPSTKGRTLLQPHPEGGSLYICRGDRDPARGGRPGPQPCPALWRTASLISMPRASWARSKSAV